MPLKVIRSFFFAVSNRNMVHARIYDVGAPSERTPRNAVAIVTLAVEGVRRHIL
jgi:hypothetical protein